MKKAMLHITTTLILILNSGCVTHPGAKLPNHETFYNHSIEEIQSEIISAYLSSDGEWSIKNQTKNSLTFTKVNDETSGFFMQAMVSGSAGALPIIESQFSFAKLSNSVKVYPKVRVINTNGYGRQEVTNVDNPAGAKQSLHEIKLKMEPTKKQSTAATKRVSKIQLQVDNNGVVTAVPLQSSAYRVGIKIGDKIIKVDGKNTGNLKATEIIGLTEGTKGSVVEITLKRADKTLKCKVKREL